MTEPRRTESTSLPPDLGKFQLFTSLKTEMMLNLAVLGTAALSLAALNVVVLESIIGTRNGAIYLGLLFIADIVLFVAFGAYKIQGLVLDPLDEIVDTTEAIAAGDLSRRAPKGKNREFARLSRSVNRMTARILEEQAQRTHLEKVASVGRLAAGVAHEIGNPLGAINGYAHLLEGSVPKGTEAAEAVGGIVRESERIDRIMRGMLEYARPRRRVAGAVDVSEVAEHASEMLRDQGALRGVTLHTNLAKDVPALGGDRHEMEQVFVNLLLNAVDALDGKGEIWLVTQCVPFGEIFGTPAQRRAGDPRGVTMVREQSARMRAWLNTVGEPSRVVKVIVADNGPGVSLADSERIFDPFYTTKDPNKGTGLGLAIVSRIIESMGGTIWVRAAREGGAAFMVYFPVPENAASDAGGAAAPAS
ncbi:MAG TPA: ATP-binding protein [Gemmatimonadaceae bacterium]|nr:ATP-binding protein [Gemmatimonadaceae bacterium]